MDYYTSLKCKTFLLSSQIILTPVFCVEAAELYTHFLFQFQNPYMCFTRCHKNKTLSSPLQMCLAWCSTNSLKSEFMMDSWCWQAGRGSSCVKAKVCRLMRWKREGVMWGPHCTAREYYTCTLKIFVLTVQLKTQHGQIRVRLICWREKVSQVILLWFAALQIYKSYTRQLFQPWLGK